MVSYEFPFRISYGRDDEGESIVSVSLTDEEGERLFESARGLDSYELDQDPSVSDIYDKVYEEIVSQTKWVLMENEDRLESLLGEIDPEEGLLEEQLDSYIRDCCDIDIDYPEDLWDLEEDDEDEDEDEDEEDQE